MTLQIILNQVIVSHRCKGAGVHGAIAEKFVHRSVVLVGSGTRHNVDLSATSAAHVGCIAARFNLELHHRVGRWAQVLGIERRVRICGTVQQEEVGIRRLPPITMAERWPGRQ